MAFQAGATATAAALSRWIPPAQPSTADTFTTIKVLADDTVTFTANPLFAYKVGWTTQHSSTASSACTVAARFIAGAGPILTTSTRLWSRVFQATAGIDTFSTWRFVPAGVLSGLVTVGITAQANTGTVTAYGGSIDRELLIEPLGP